MTDPSELALLLTLLSVLAVVIFVTGRQMGRRDADVAAEALRSAAYKDGQIAARADAFQQCLDFAVHALQGHKDWHRLTAYDALMRAAVLLGGEEAITTAHVAADVKEQVARGDL